jgi:ABC-type multidrug transport system ATPase subunit
MIDVQNMAFGYGKKTIFKGFNLSLRAGETTLITGMNGAGKSTLLRLMAGVLLPDRGAVHYAPDLGSRPKKHIGFISDALSLYSDLTVQETLAFHQKMFEIERMDESLLDHTQIGRKEKISQLSIGQKTIVHFSLIFSQKPKVLLIDEVIHSLDAYLRQCVLDKLLEFLENKALTVVFVNLNFHDIEFLVDRVILLKAGDILVDEALDVLKSRVRRVLGPQAPEGAQVLWQRRLGGETEWYIHGEGLEGGEGVNLTEIVAAFIAGEYANGR